MGDRQREEYDAVLGALPSHTARQSGAVTAAWALVAGLIAMVVVTPLLLPHALPITSTPSVAAALPSEPAAPHTLRE